MQQKLCLNRNMEISKCTIGHRHVNVKKAMIGSKRWKEVRATFKSKKFRDWSIINKRKINNVL